MRFASVVYVEKSIGATVCLFNAQVSHKVLELYTNIVLEPLAAPYMYLNICASLQLKSPSLCCSANCRALPADALVSLICCFLVGTWQCHFRVQVSHEIISYHGCQLQNMRLLKARHWKHRCSKSACCQVHLEHCPPTEMLGYSNALEPTKYKLAVSCYQRGQQMTITDNLVQACLLSFFFVSTHLGHVCASAKCSITTWYLERYSLQQDRMSHRIASR